MTRKHLTKLVLLTSPIVFMLAQQPGCALDSMAEAYLEQGKRDFDRGDFAAAKKLFNKAAFNAENTYSDKVYVAAIYHNAGEAYKKLFEVNQSYSDIKDDTLAEKFLRAKLTKFDASTDANLRTVTADETEFDYGQNELKNRNFPNQAIDSRARMQWIAVHYFRLALQVKEIALGASSAEVAKSMESLAMLYYEFDTSLEEAEALLRKALEIRKQVSGPDSTDVAITLWDLGKVLKYASSQHNDPGAKKAMLEDAEKSLSSALTILRSKKLIKSTLAGQCSSELSIIHFDQSKFPEAIIEFNQAYDILSLDSGHRKDFQIFKRSHAPIAELALKEQIDEYVRVKAKPKQMQLTKLASLRRAAVRSGDLAKVAEVDEMTKKIKNQK